MLLDFGNTESIPTQFRDKMERKCTCEIDLVMSKLISPQQLSNNHLNAMTSLECTFLVVSLFVPSPKPRLHIEQTPFLVYRTKYNED